MTLSNRSKSVPPAVVIAGPTGAGKSGIAVKLASRIGGEIVNYDSVQVYRGFDIGSAKATPEQRAAIPHHLLDIVEADQQFSPADFATHAAGIIAEMRGRGRVPILVGGTGFYLRALLVGLPEMPGRDEVLRRRIRSIWERPGGAQRLYRRLARIDPTSAGKIAPADRHRIERAIEVYLLSGRPISTWKRPDPDASTRFDTLRFAIDLPRPLLNETLDLRVTLMYEKGLVEETRNLLERYDPDCRPFGTIGYREAVRVVRGEISLLDAIAETRRRTRAYAKRQRTWLRGESGFEHFNHGDLSEDQIVEMMRSRIGRWEQEPEEDPS